MTSLNIADAMAQAFCEECRKRRLCISGIVRGDMPLTKVQLDQLHQEFDTLYCGARAVHLPELENFFSSLTRYARHLRMLQDAGTEVDPQAWQRLLADIEIWSSCCDELSGCVAHSRSDLARLLQDLENINNRG